MNLYHGTSLEKAQKIMEHGFTKGGRRNWKVKSKPGFVYFSTAYAPFFSVPSSPNSHKKALIKVKVDEDKLYPDDDFIMRALKKSVYTQEEIDSIDFDEFKYLAKDSLRLLGCACAKIEDVKIIGMQAFDSKKLIIICDPTITPLNYQFMGDYYRSLSDTIYEGKDYIEWAKEYNKQRMELFFKGDKVTK